MLKANWRAVMASAVVVLVSALTALRAPEIPLSEQLTLLGNLQTTSAIIFGIIGAWIAIIYPKTLTSLNSPLSHGYRLDAQRYQSLLAPLRLSTLVLLTVSIITPALSIIKNLKFYSVSANQAMTHRVLFGVLISLSLAQLVAILLSLGPVRDSSRTALSESRRRAGNEGALKLLQPRPGEDPVDASMAEDGESVGEDREEADSQ